MNVQDIKTYLEKLDPAQILTLNDGEVSINRIYLDSLEDLYFLSTDSTKYVKIKDILKQIEKIDPRKWISFRDIAQDKTMKDSFLNLKDGKLFTEKQDINYNILFYYFSELNEDYSIQDIEYLTSYYGKALESYFGIDEVRFYKDGSLKLKDIHIYFSGSSIDLEYFDEYFVYTKKLNKNNFEKFREDLKKYVETSDFTIFKYDGDFSKTKQIKETL